MREVGESNKKWGYFCHTASLNVFSLFSLHFGEKSFCGLGWKIPRPHTKVFFPLLSPPNQTTHKFIFSPIFFQKNFILPISPPNKHTLKVEKQHRVVLNSNIYLHNNELRFFFFFWNWGISYYAYNTLQTLKHVPMKIVLELFES